MAGMVFSMVRITLGWSSTCLISSWTHSKFFEVFKALLKHPLVTVLQVNERHVLCNANQSQLARKRMKRNGMILAQCQRTKPPDGTSLNMNSLTLISRALLNVIRYIEGSRFIRNSCFWYHFWDENSWKLRQLPIGPRSARWYPVL